jgi:hypothetical protein
LLSENKKLLDNLGKRERLKRLLYLFITTLFITIFLYFIFDYQSFYELEQSENVKTSISAKVLGASGSRGGQFCSYELSSGEIITTRCPSELFVMGSEVKLIKVIKSSGYIYYETEDAFITKLKTLIHDTNGKIDLH